MELSYVNIIFICSSSNPSLCSSFAPSVLIFILALFGACHLEIVAIVCMPQILYDSYLVGHLPIESVTVTWSKFMFQSVRCCLRNFNIWASGLAVSIWTPHLVELFWLLTQYQPHTDLIQGDLYQQQRQDGSASLCMSCLICLLSGDKIIFFTWNYMINLFWCMCAHVSRENRIIVI
jgi:hypothetical protein